MSEITIKKRRILDLESLAELLAEELERVKDYQEELPDSDVRAYVYAKGQRNVIESILEMMPK